MGLTTGMLVVYLLVAAAAVLFVTEWIPAEATALAVAVSLALLQPWTGVTPLEAISGFASPATVTVLAMFILSEGVRRSGAVERLGGWLARRSGGGERRMLGLTLGLGAPAAGFVNNTPLVAVLIPTVVDMARRSRVSPSRLLMPLSFATMLGGTLTLLGTSTNLLASDLSRRLLDHPIGLFEFTALGLMVMAAGIAYLMVASPRLVPERVRPERDLTQNFGMRSHLRRLLVPAESPLVGTTLREAKAGEAFDLDVLQVVRGPRVYLGPTTDQELKAGDVLTVRAAPGVVRRYARAAELRPRRRETVTDGAFVDGEHTLMEVTVSPGSGLAGQTLASYDFRRRLGGTVLAVRRGTEVIRDGVDRSELREGDALLVMMERDRLGLLEGAAGLEVTATTPAERSDGGRDGRTAGEDGRGVVPALAIVAAVVTAAATGLLPIYIAALAGVVLMVAAGCISLPRAYEAVSWNVVFLLAGLIPLGIAMAKTGAAAYLADAVVAAGAGRLPPVAVLGLFYLLTAALASFMSSTATAVVMIPVAVDAAGRLGADPFAFLLAVTFAAGTAFATPVGYQTNLMVYTPGGYRFGDYLRLGVPLQLLTAAVTTAGIAWIWGL